MIWFFKPKLSSRKWLTKIKIMLFNLDTCTLVVNFKKLTRVCADSESVRNFSEPV